MDNHAAPGSLLHSFERHLRAQNHSERTVGNYLESARLAENFLEGRGKQLEEATQADLEDFLGDILPRRSANTAATRYKVLRVLYRWLEEEEELPNPMARMKPHWPVNRAPPAASAPPPGPRPDDGRRAGQYGSHLSRYSAGESGSVQSSSARSSAVRPACPSTATWGPRAVRLEPSLI
jgi:Phage integrase, N-terminal SAM-like domain